MATKKKSSPPMTMKQEDVKHRQRLLEKWNFTCIICGHEFANLACVTKEHLVPKAFRECAELTKDVDNIAPSHYSCNQIRGTHSLFVAIDLIKRMQRRLLPDVFLDWLNRPVPHRIVPPEALQPIVRPTRMRRSFELPEHLPGMF